MPRTAVENHAVTEREASNRRPVLLAVAVATAGALAAILAGRRMVLRDRRTETH